MIFTFEGFCSVKITPDPNLNSEILELSMNFSNGVILLVSLA
jgi:hypothetical protein